MFGIGVPELLVVLGVGLVIFGPGKLPEIGAGLGKSIKDFTSAVLGRDDVKEDQGDVQAKVD